MTFLQKRKVASDSNTYRPVIFTIISITELGGGASNHFNGVTFRLFSTIYLRSDVITVHWNYCLSISMFTYFVNAASLKPHH